MRLNTVMAAVLRPTQIRTLRPEAYRQEAVLRIPPSRAQIAGITVAAGLGAVGGLIAFVVAEYVGVAGIGIWIPFVLCEGLALFAGNAVLYLQRQRRAFLSVVLSFVMDLEGYIEDLDADPKGIRAEAQLWRDALLASRDRKLAERLMAAMRMREEERQSRASQTTQAQTAATGVSPPGTPGARTS